MKILKVTLLVSLLLLGLGIFGFILIGISNPEVTYTNSVTVEKPVAHAWVIFSDAEKLDRWLVGMESIETLEGEPMTEGSRYRLTFNVEGEEFIVTELVTDVQPLERFAFELESDALNSQNEIRFIPVDSTTTRIEARSTARGNGIFWKSLLALSGSAMRQESQKSYDQLKRLIETTPDSATVKDFR